MFAALIGLICLSYYDVRTSVGSAPTLVSVGPDPMYIVVLRWRIGQYHPDLDMPGQYVLWTLRPFRKVHWFK
jgi:hypothetical protein